MKPSLGALVLLAIVLTNSMGRAQIPNAGFESWTGGNPDGWATSNAAPVYTNVTKSTTAHTGSAALKGESIQYFSVVMQPTVQSGPHGGGFAYAGRPTSITGWYQFNGVSGDRFGVNVGLFKGGINGAQVAIAASADATTRGSYTQFNVPFVYLTGDTPDTCIAQFLIALPEGGSTTHVGSYFLLDDLAFGGGSSVESTHEAPFRFALEQNYPNPFNPTTIISCQLPATGHVRLAVYDLLGQEVAVLIDGWKQPGSYTVAFDGTGLSSGIYYYRLSTEQGVMTKAMTLLR